MVQSLFSPSLREQATFYRAALLLGLVQADEVVRWADAEIARAENAPAALCDIALTPIGDGSDLTKLRAALRRIADERESPAVAVRLIERAATDLAVGRRNEKDTITVLGQMRGSLALADDIREALHPFGIDYMLASVGVTGSIGGVEARLRDWLLPQATNHVLELAGVDEVSAFVAALSRFSTSPDGVALRRMSPPMFVWTGRRNDTAGGPPKSRVFLSAGALRLAEHAFSPVPVAREVEALARPLDAVLILESGSLRPIGADETAGLLA